MSGDGATGEQADKSDQNKPADGEDYNESRQTFAGIFFWFAVFGIVTLVLLNYELNDFNPAIAGSVIFAFYLILAFLMWYLARWIDENLLYDPDFHNSFYYLGFIMTLSSLAYSIYLISGVAAANRPAELEKLFISNGIALVTTIIGLIARNFLNFKYSRAPENALDGVTEQIQASMEHINRAATMLGKNLGDLQQKIGQVNVPVDETKKLKTALDTLNTSMTTAATSANQAIKTGKKKLTELDDRLTSSAENIKAMGERASSAKEKFSDLSSALAALITEVNNSSGSLEGAISGIVNKINELSGVVNILKDEIDKIDIPVSEASKLKTVLDTLNTSFENLSNASDRTIKIISQTTKGAIRAGKQKFDELNDTLKTSAGNLATLQNNSDSTNTKFVEITQNLGAASEALKKLGEDLKTTETTISEEWKKLPESLKDTIKSATSNWGAELKTAFAHPKAEIEKYTTAIRNMAAALIKFSRDTPQKAKANAKSIEKASKAYNDNLEYLKTVMDNIHTQGEDLNKALAALKDAIQKIQS